MTKKDEFLWIVQTVLIRNAINLSLNVNDINKYRHEISATGAFGTCDDALRASKMIPDDMTSSDAANSFLSFMLDNWKDQEEEATGDKQTVPSWFARFI